MKLDRNFWKLGLVLASATLALFLSPPAHADSVLATDPAVMALNFTEPQQDYFYNHEMYGYCSYASFDMNDASLMKNRYFIRMGQNAFMERKSDSMESDIHPQLLKIHTGDTVSFWADGRPHAIQNFRRHGIFPETVPLGSGQMYSYTFLKPGTFQMSDGLGKINCQCECMTIIVSGAEVLASSYLPAPYVQVKEVARVYETVDVMAPRLTRANAAETPAAVVVKPAAVATPRPRDKDVK